MDIKSLIASWTEDDLKSETKIFIAVNDQYRSFPLPLQKVKERFEGPEPEDWIVCPFLPCPWSLDWPGQINEARNNEAELARLVAEDPLFKHRLVLSSTRGVTPLEFSKYERNIDVLEGRVTVLCSSTEIDEREAKTLARGYHWPSDEDLKPIIVAIGVGDKFWIPPCRIYTLVCRERSLVCLSSIVPPQKKGH
ncbi:hypothetical protein NW762_008866 [Fusarium torreyae]|uniref:Uncharacterized protein n=1 Tax=Fusarium torreyae TaxID=1237075 RepID=A0A9W8VF45_9HYPO|nr:hypothetical protein NW762_008866 [Fusarium torreyae]